MLWRGTLVRMSLHLDVGLRTKFLTSYRTGRTAVPQPLSVAVAPDMIDDLAGCSLVRASRQIAGSRAFSREV